MFDCTTNESTQAAWPTSSRPTGSCHICAFPHHQLLRLLLLWGGSGIFKKHDNFCAAKLGDWQRIIRTYLHKTHQTWKRSFKICISIDSSDLKTFFHLALTRVTPMVAIFTYQPSALNTELPLCFLFCSDQSNQRGNLTVVPCVHSLSTSEGNLRHKCKQYSMLDPWASHDRLGT